MTCVAVFGMLILSTSHMTFTLAPNTIIDGVDEEYVKVYQQGESSHATTLPFSHEEFVNAVANCEVKS